MTWGGGRPHPVGDKGQRYEVRYQMDGAEKIFGWSDDPQGAQAMVASINAHPSMCFPVIVDRARQL